MKQEVAQIDATPNKRIYRSIIADYRLETALCELIDNAIDNWLSPRRKDYSLKINIGVDVDQQSLCVQDNSGGVPELLLKKLISPGESSSEGSEETIGVFGVGSKRAVVALAQHVQFTTRHRKGETFRVEYDDEWLQSDDWSLPYHRLTDDIPPHSTHIALSRLRFKVSEDDVSSLKRHLSSTYAYLIQKHGIQISVGDSDITPSSFENWAYPQDLQPRLIKKTLTVEGTNHKIEMRITGGLRRDRAEDLLGYGVYIYCNNRLICSALKDLEVGYATGIAGAPHHTASLCRVIVQLTGPSMEMPWNSSKTSVNYNHKVFAAIRPDIVEVVKAYSVISRRVSNEYDTLVFPCEEGEIKEETLGRTEVVKASRLPKIPPAKRPHSLVSLNQSLCTEKPWIRGLCEAMMAEEMISKKKGFEQQSRISLIILDSTLEIALKDYLAFEAPTTLGDEKLRTLFNNRIDVHKEVAKTITALSESMRKKMEYFYKKRCDLIHKRTVAEIPSKEIEEYRKLVLRILTLTCGIRTKA